MASASTTRSFDAFVSHSSSDRRFATRVVRALEVGGHEVWLDEDDLRFGSLLRSEISNGISSSRVLVLLWSKAAAKSRWVISEALTAFHSGCFIVPWVLDATPLPQFLANAAYLSGARGIDRLLQKLVTAVARAPKGPNQLLPLVASQSDVVRNLADGIGAAQLAALLAIDRDFAKAKTTSAKLHAPLKQLLELAPDDARAIALAGYQCKNDYLFKHWKKIQAGQAPPDPLLLRAERHFFRVLAVNPVNEDAINGLGSILIFERELDAAEFFVRRAIELAKRRRGNYEAAKRDLAMMLYFKAGAQGTELRRTSAPNRARRSRVNAPRRA